MAEILKGAPVTAALNEKMAAKAAQLKESGVIPALAILRVGERSDDLSYERGAMKRCEAVGVEGMEQSNDLTQCHAVADRNTAIRPIRPLGIPLHGVQNLVDQVVNVDQLQFDRRI